MDINELPNENLDLNEVFYSDFPEQRPRKRKRLRKRKQITFNRKRKLKQKISRRVNNFLTNPNKDHFTLNFNNRHLTRIDYLSAIQNNLMNFIIHNDDGLIIHSGNRAFTLNSNNIYDFINKYNSYELNELNIEGSDEGVIYEIRNNNNIQIEKLNIGRYRLGGAFFPYLNNTKYNLEDLGIYKTLDYNNYKENCLIKALKQAKINEEYIDNIKIAFTKQNIPQKDLKKVVKIIKHNIRLHIYNENKNRKFRQKNYIYDKNNKNFIELGLIKDHYFYNKKLEITSYSIKNYNELKNIKDFNKIYKKRKNGSYNITNKQFIDSKTIIKLMLENNLFSKMEFTDEFFKTQYKKELKINSLNTNEEHFKEIKYKKPEYPNIYINGTSKKIDYEKNIIFFDFETYIDEKTKKHIPYLCCSIDKNEHKQTFYGEDCGKQLLDSIKSHSILIAHNSSYDLNFLVKYLYKVENIIKNNNKSMLIQASYNHHQLLIKDSCAMISMPLRNFGDCFKLNQEKEVISYDSYNDYFNNLRKYKNGLYPIHKIKKEFNKKNKNKEYIQFLKNIIKWGIKKGEYFDIIMYSQKYCMIDCKVLKEGYNIFRKWMLNLCEIDILKVISIASLAHKYFIKEGCFDNCYNLSGVARYFIQQSIVGGRCMSNKNKKYHIKRNKNLIKQKEVIDKYGNVSIEGNIKIVDFDAVSLYPSAMSRLPGYLKGKPKIIENENLNYNFLQKQDGYFVEIKLTRIGIKRDFSLISKVNEKTLVRDFHNNYENETFIVDKITLEDWIKYHNIKFDVIKGYYFNEGFNTKIKEVINKIFNERLKMKDEKNPVELVYKLLMNSAYGKTIQKPVDNEIKTFNNKQDKDNFVKYNFNYIDGYDKIEDSDLWIVYKMKPIIEHFSCPHIGSNVLSMSKRIMNEVMTTAEDNNIKIFYQDTDSTHLIKKDIPKLEKIFNKKFGRKLIGKNMGQFHDDFSLKDKNGYKCKDVYSEELIILGKKCYIDKLVGKDKEGNIIKGHHIRMKGVPTTTILYECNKLNITPIEIYIKLLNGEAISFDLLEGNNKCKFKQNKNYSINSLTEFSRTLQFI